MSIITNNSSSHSKMANIAMPMHKNKLQEYTQKQRLPLPAYRTANEGLQHAPKFRTTVYVDGAEYTSKSTFHRLRESEQDAAKIAYECIVKDHGEIPKYKKTIILGDQGDNNESRLSLYVSKVIVSDKTFTGGGASNKREAEQSAARAALDSLQLEKDPRGDLSQMTSSKRKYSAGAIQVNNLVEKKIKNRSFEEAGDASQVKRLVTATTARPPLPPSSRPETRHVFRRRPANQRVRIGLGNVPGDGGTLMNIKNQQHGRGP